METLAIVGAAFGVIGTLAGAVAVAFSVYIRTTVATLKESNGAQAERITILEGEASRDRDKIEVQASQITTLTSERDTLARVITGEAHLVAIEGALSDHHIEAKAWWGDLGTTLHEIRDLLGAEK